MRPAPTVFLIDDDAAVRHSLRALLDSVNLNLKSYDSCESFLDDYEPDQPGCLVLDVRLPGMDGLELQDQLNRRGVRIPIVFITGYGEVPVAVRAMRGGAFDFLEKPCGNQILLERIRRAIKLDAENRKQAQEFSRIEVRMQTLTGREREILDLVATGLSSKQIASRLGIATKTVDTHRANVISKLEALSLADLVRMVWVAKLSGREPAGAGER